MKKKRRKSLKKTNHLFVHRSIALTFIVLFFLLTFNFLVIDTDTSLLLQPIIGSPLSPRGGEKTLSSSSMDISFTINDTTVTLDNITNLQTLHTFYFSSDPLWELTITNLSDYSKFLVGPDICSSLDSTETAETISFNWQDCVIEGTNSFDIELTVAIEEVDTRWRLSIDNNLNDYGIYLMSIPIGIVDEPAQDSFAVLPYPSGALAKNPSNSLQGQLPWAGGQGSFQATPYYLEDGNGLYIAAADGTATELKRWAFSGDGTHYFIENSYYPTNTLIPLDDKDMPYDFIIGVYEGDWYDAAKKYRSWAQETVILEMGPLKTRADIPEWYKEIDLLQAHNSIAFENPQEFAQVMEDVKNYYGADNVAVFSFGWADESLGYGFEGDYVPDPLVAPVVSALTDKGIRTLLRVLSFGFDTDNPLYSSLSVSDWLKENETGHGYVAPLSGTAHIDHSSSFWENQIINHIVGDSLLGTVGASGMYWDNPYPWATIGYESDHDHPPGPGGNWQYAAYVDLMKNLRSESRLVNPDFVTAHEVAHEAYIRAGDTSGPSGLNGDFPHEDISPIPFYQTAYSGYVILYPSNGLTPNWLQGPSPYTDLADLNIANTPAFMNGHFPLTQESLIEHIDVMIPNYQVGDYFTEPIFAEDVEKIVNHTVYMRSLVQARKYARDYFTYGELLRSLPTDAIAGTTTYRYLFSDPQYLYDLTTYNVYNSVWLSPESRIGIFFSNHNPSTESITYTFDFSEYGLTEGSHYGLYFINESGRFHYLTINQDFEDTLSLQPYSITGLEFIGLPQYSSFDGATTNFSMETDIIHVSDAVLEKTSYGKIEYTGEVIDFSELNLDSNVFIEENSVEILSSAIPALDVPATITLYDVSFDEPEIYKDGSLCDEQECVIVTYDGSSTSPEDIVFTVTGFSEYEVVEAGTSPGSGDDSDSDSGGGDSGGGGGDSTDSDGPECDTGDTKTCDTGDEGVCASGVQICSAGLWGSCIAEESAGYEFCDGLDNNCNGEVDEFCGTEANLCDNGDLDVGEEGIDCGGPCIACETESPLGDFFDDYGLYVLMGFITLGVVGVLTLIILRVLQKRKERAGNLRKVISPDTSNKFPLRFKS